MFETQDDVMSMFEQFRSVDKADLGTSQALEKHALLVMNALDEAIADILYPEFLVEKLLTTGKSHQRFENFHPTMFWVCQLIHSDCYSVHADGSRVSIAIIRLCNTVFLSVILSVCLSAR